MIATAAIALVVGASFGQRPPVGASVVLAMSDGVRRQEVFSGADRALLDAAKSPEATRRFWRETPEARRQALMPFFWGVVAKRGRVYGSLERPDRARLTNDQLFSYPGYNEVLTGFPDPAIRSNDAIPNPNVTVLEWLNRRPGMAGRVAAFGAWDAISAIVNAKRGGFLANTGYEPLTAGRMTPEIQLLNRLKQEIPKVWGVEPYDALTFRTALEYVRTSRPRVLYLSLGETDEWAHAGDYAQYLFAVNRYDQYLRELWTSMQSMPQYRGKTSFALTVDHGRGDGAKWTSHGASVPQSRGVWMAFLPWRAPRAGRAEGAVTSAQVAATVAALAGFDYAAGQPKAGRPILSALP